MNFLNKIIALLVIFLGIQMKGQEKITVKMTPPTQKLVVLYSAEGAQQKYVTHADSVDGVFSLNIPSNAPNASYRLVYNRETMDYIDFLYVGKSFEVHFNPDKKEELPVFIGSDENKRFYEYLFKINSFQGKMDSVQVEVFKTQDATAIAEMSAKYLKYQTELKKTVDFVDKNETNVLIKDILKAHERVLPEKPIQNPEEYLPYVKKHFFDHIDFNNQNLIHSSILVDKVMDYVFYLTVAEDINTQNNLYVKTSHEVLEKIKDINLKKGFIQALIQSFYQDENVYVIDDLFNNYYSKLPQEMQDGEWKNNLLQELSTAISRTAPDFEFYFNKSVTKLSKLEGYNYYVVVFWSTTCSHCLQEIPMFYDYVKDLENVKVIAVGMETEESKDNWNKEVFDYPAFINVLGLNKWENSIARMYNIHATPNYFVLDANKVIIAKPYDFEALEKVFETLK